MKQAIVRRAVQSLFVPIALGLSLPVLSAGDKAQQQGMQASAGSSPSANADQRPARQLRHIRAKELLGAAITDKAGRHIGEVQDLIVHLDSGDVAYAAITLGGVKGVPRNRVYAVPIKELKLGGRGDKVVFDADVQRVKQLSSWKRDRWARIPAAVWRESDNPEEPWAENMGPASAGSGSPGLSQDHTFRASKLLGKDVESPSGEILGTLKEMLIDLDTQKVRYAVIGFDPGILSAERNRAFPLQDFAVPRASADRAGEIDTLVLNVRSERLKGLSGFADDNWPDFDDSNFLSELNRRFDRWLPDGGSSVGATDGERR